MDILIKISMEINKTKAKLIKKAKEKGLYENFGQKELRNLEDKYAYCHWSNRDDRVWNLMVWNLISEFGKWCMNFDDHDLRGY